MQNNNVFAVVKVNIENNEMIYINIGILNSIYFSHRYI